MNKYMVTIGNGFPQISDSFIVYSKDSVEDLEWNYKFLAAVDNQITQMYYSYGEDDESQEDFVDEMGIDAIEEWKDEFDSYNLPILYDERNE